MEIPSHQYVENVLKRQQEKKAQRDINKVLQAVQKDLPSIIINALKKGRTTIYIVLKSKRALLKGDLKFIFENVNIFHKFEEKGWFIQVDDDTANHHNNIITICPYWWSILYDEETQVSITLGRVHRVHHGERTVYNTPKNHQRIDLPIS